MKGQQLMQATLWRRPPNFLMPARVILPTGEICFLMLSLAATSSVGDPYKLMMGEFLGLLGRTLPKKALLKERKYKLMELQGKKYG